MARRRDGAVATVGRLTVEPNVINTIPGRVVMSVDIRHPDGSVLDALVGEIERLAASVSAETGVGIGLERFWTSEPTPFDPRVREAVAAACKEMGLPFRRLWSSAGHDAKYLQDVCPSAMIFVRSRDGLSHSEQEYSSPADLEAGANVLLRAALKLAGDAGI